MNTNAKPVLTTKLLNEKLKENWGTAQFAAHLQISETEFKKVFDKIFQSRPGGESFRRRIEKNNSRIEKRENQQRKRKAVYVKTNLFKETVKETEQDKVADTADFSEVGNNEEKDIDVLKKLQREEESYRNCLNSLENDYKVAEAERKQLCEEIDLIRVKMIELRKEIEECETEAERYTNKRNKISARIDKIDQDKAKTKMQIAEIQEQIKKFQKIEVYVDNGYIEIVPEDYEIPDGWKGLRREWLDDERFESLTLMELSILAKAILLAKAISADGRKSVFVFESDQMQDLFSEFSK